MAEEEEEIIMEEIPQEIITEILSWLPAKSLLSSFKFVCKSWRTVIQDPVFVKMHLNRGAINGGGGGGGSNNNNSLICKSGRDLFQLHPPFNFEGVPTVTPTTNLEFPSPLSNRLRGSCNGLLFISVKNDECVILVNPCTRKFKVSPKHPIELLPTFVKQGLVSYGFGCCYNSSSTDDNNIDEYKVIRIVSFSNSECSLVYQVDIYYMSSNSWRRETRFRDYPYAISDNQSGVFVNGALHWMGFNDLDVPIGDTWDTIVSFHVRDEEFRLVPVPLSCEPTADDPYFHLQHIVLMNMKGCLSMIRFPEENNNRMNVDLEIWVMKEYGIKESWIKEFVIRSSEPIGDPELSGFEASRTSNAYVLKGNQILIEGMGQIDPDKYDCREKLVLYDIDKKKIDEDFKMVGVPDQPSFNQVDYIETLVSLKSSLLPLSNNRKRENRS